MTTLAAIQPKTCANCGRTFRPSPRQEDRCAVCLSDTPFASKPPKDDSVRSLLRAIFQEAGDVALTTSELYVKVKELGSEASYHTVSNALSRDRDFLRAEKVASQVWRPVGSTATRVAPSELPDWAEKNKKCKTCKEMKPIAEFSRSGLGYRPACQTCDRGKSRKRYNYVAGPAEPVAAVAFDDAPLVTMLDIFLSYRRPPTPAEAELHTLSTTLWRRWAREVKQAEADFLAEMKEQNASRWEKVKEDYTFETTTLLFEVDRISAALRAMRGEGPWPEL